MLYWDQVPVRHPYNDFLDTTPKIQSMKEIIDKLNFIEIKNFCPEKENPERIRK